MARNIERSMAQRIAELEHRIRHLECATKSCPPDPGWVLAETEDGMAYLYVPSGALGPTIGVKS